MNKRVIFLIILIFLLLQVIDISSAKITISNNLSDRYLMGDSITPNIEVASSIDGYLILSASIVCDNFNLVFYKSPELLSKGKIKKIEFDGIPVNGEMVGKCNIESKIEDFKGKIMESFSSKMFEISNLLSVSVNKDKENYIPGEFVVISGNVERDGVFNLKLKFDGESVLDKEINNKFIEKIKLDNNLKGDYNLMVLVRDSFGNSRYKTVKISVVSVAKGIINNISKKRVYPNENLSIRGSVYDQSGDLISSKMNISITDSNGLKFINKEIYSGEDLYFKIEEYSRPGKYTVYLNYGNLKNSAEFIVEEVSEMNISIINSSISIVNFGNIRNVEKGKITASVEGVSYGINFETDLYPKDVKIINLSKDIPTDVYNIGISYMNKTYVFENVSIVGNRAMNKIISQSLKKMMGLSGITGNSININTDDNKPFIGLIFFVILFMAITSYVMNNFFKKKTIKLKNKNIGFLKRNLKEESERTKKIRDSFSQYVDKDLVESKMGLKHGVEKKEISVLFTDIRAFSKIFDELDEIKVTKILNEYFRRANEAIKRNKGMVNKFIGDSVMALFNAVVSDEKHLENCAKSALEIREDIDKLNVELKRNGIKEIGVGIGIDSGISAVGNLGSEKKIEYSAIGIPVNIASRLQGIAKASEILVSERVYNKLNGKFEFLYKGEFTLKNISKSVRVYNLIREI